MGNFTEFEARYWRREILQILAGDTDYTCNESLLRMMLAERGFRVSGDQLRNELSWLCEQGLAKVREIGDLQIATVLARGADVASGAISVPGVQRPEPGRT